MASRSFAIIEIGSNNTKTHIYESGTLIYENEVTIEFKKHYQCKNMIIDEDLDKLYSVIEKALEYSKEIHLYGCSIFRSIEDKQLDSINDKLQNLFGVKIEVVSQKDEALFTALSCYDDVDYDGNICIFIGGGGSTELIFVNRGKVINQKYYPFGVVDITKKFPSLREDIPTCTFDEVYHYVDEIMGDIDTRADILILAGGNHLYWYHHACYQLLDNTLYSTEKQKYMLTISMSDQYDHDALVTSLDKIRQRSDNPIWFDGSRAMKVITNLISHKIDAKYLIPTNINMEDGIKKSLENTTY